MKADVVDRFYNVGTGKRTSLKELAEMLLELTGCEKADPATRRAARPTLVRNRIGSPKRASARDRLHREGAISRRGWSA